MKVLLLSRYGSLGASSRMRFLQYLPYFKSQDISVTVEPLFSDRYVKAIYTNEARLMEVAKGYFKRFIILFTVFRYDVVIIEKELFPFMPAIVERFLRLINIPYLVDYDDAIFHQYDCHSNPLVRLLLGRKIDTVMRFSSAVTVGNSYLANRAKLAGAKKIEIIPTVIDEKKYAVKESITNDIPIVGWIGTPKTSKYLKSLLPVFSEISNEIPVRFVAVGASIDDFKDTVVEVWPWTEDTEVSSIQKFNIGIMPLEDSPWERGKCGYKLIQYMACGVAIVASPVGVNCEIVKPGNNGELAGSDNEWKSVLIELLKNKKNILEDMGSAGRDSVDTWYSLNMQAPRFLSAVRAVIK